MQALLRAGIHAFSAPYALWGLGNFLQREVHWTGFFAGHTRDTQVLFPLDLHKAEPVEPAINSPKWTQILAEGPVNLHGEQRNANQNSQLPKEQTASLATKSLVCTKQRNRAEQGAGGAQIFAKRRDFCKSSKQKHGTNAHQKNQYCIFSILQDMVTGQILLLFEDGDFVQKILHQSKRAQPAADKAPQKAAEQKEKAQCGKGNLKASLVEQRLQGADGARGDGAWTGVAVQSWNTDVFQAAAVDFPGQKTVHISICNNGEQQLYCQPKSFHVSPNPDALQADHHCLFPYHSKLPLQGSGSEEEDAHK